MSASKGIYAKLLSIQRAIGEVELRRADEGEHHEFAPADKVFDLVRVQLDKRRVMACPSVTSVEYLSDRVRVVIEVKFADVPTSESVTRRWAGEASTSDNGRAVAMASTTALKGLYMATFLIGAKDRPPLPKGPHLDAAAIEHMIEPCRQQAGLDHTELHQAMVELCGVQWPEHLNKRLERRLTNFLKDREAVKRFKASGSIS